MADFISSVAECSAALAKQQQDESEVARSGSRTPAIVVEDGNVASPVRELSQTWRRRKTSRRSEFNGYRRGVPRMSLASHTGTDEAIPLPSSSLVDAASPDVGSKNSIRRGVPRMSIAAHVGTDEAIPLPSSPLVEAATAEVCVSDATVSKLGLEIVDEDVSTSNFIGGTRVSKLDRKILRPDHEFIRFQAILTDLPKHVFGTSRPSSAPEKADDNKPSKLTHLDLVEAALLLSCREYPRYSEELSRLHVVHTSEDLAIFADHEEHLLFTSVRGTNPFVPRDLSDDVLVILGFAPTRVEDVKCAYCSVREQFPTYDSFGCGHSLGGSVMHELACSLEKEERYAFQRVDVFNPGGSPFQRRADPLTSTKFFAHRVGGDLVSYFYEPPGGESKAASIEHDIDPQFGAHKLGHFLPRRQQVSVTK